MKKLIVAVALVATTLVFAPFAHSASNSDCLGYVPNIFGTSGNDDIYVQADEAGAGVTVNGKHTFLESWEGPITIWSKAGHDKVAFSSDGGGGAVVCTGDGDDTVSGGMIGRVHTGSGYDRVTQYLECNYSSEVFKAEIVKSSYDNTNEEGPCN